MNGSIILLFIFLYYVPLAALRPILDLDPPMQFIRVLYRCFYRIIMKSKPYQNIK